ncbi:MAG: LPS export ABC transporter periplasmic protein LptC, partial [Pyrinomonadaceae bacterium]|nr:LPS export ABC transporter periplasmic protein LptC [Pyrinomonadaceae bacterium]
MSAKRAIYVPEEDGSKNFTIYFAGNVDILTRDALTVKTEQLKYSKKTEIADAEELVEFARHNLSGRSYGAIVSLKSNTLDLLK